MRVLLLVVVSLLVAGCELVPQFLGHTTHKTDIGGSGGGGPLESDGCGGLGHSGPQTDAVIAPAKAPPAISGGTMAILSDGTVVAADSDRDQLHLYRVDRDIWHITLPEGSEPGRVIEGPRGTVFVALRAHSQVAVVEIESGEVALQQVCASPRGLAYEPKQSLLFAACATGELAKVWLGPAKHITTVSRPAPDLRDLMWKDGQLWATSFRSAQLWEIDPLTLRATALPSPAPQFPVNVQLKPQVAWRAVLVNGTVTMVHQLEQADQVAAPGVCSGSYGLGGSGVPTVTSAVTTLDGAGAVTNFTGGVLPVDIAVASNGRVALVSAGTKEVVFPGPNGSFTPLALPEQPVSLAFQPNGELWVFSREPASFTVINESNVVTRRISLSPRSAFSTGHELFHQSTANLIACASCHPEAGEDGHVWALPEGTFKTPSLRGGLSGTEPFHWAGEETDMPVLLSDIFVARMNGAPQSAERTGALLSWLDAQPVRAAPSDLDAAAVARGAATFASAGCAACHSGKVGSNNASVDVGSGGVFQVPRLVELAYRAPFMHDGRAATLEDRFTTLGGAEHAVAPSQLADLVAYLQTR
ncbi:MAG: c-type cytochrome [Myxococcaceae bacterium]